MKMVWKLKPMRIGAAGAMMAAALLATSPALAANAVLEGGVKTIKEGEQAVFAVKGAADAPTDLAAQCTIRKVTGRAVITFDAEGYVPLSSPAVGDRLTLARGDMKDYSLNGAIRPASKGESYVAFSMIDQPASICFPGMDCGGNDKVATTVTVECRNAGG